MSFIDLTLWDRRARRMVPAFVRAAEVKTVLPVGDDANDVLRVAAERHGAVDEYMRARSRVVYLNGDEDVAAETPGEIIERITVSV